MPTTALSPKTAGKGEDCGATARRPFKHRAQIIPIGSRGKKPETEEQYLARIEREIEEMCRKQESNAVTQQDCAESLARLRRAGILDENNEFLPPYQLDDSNAQEG